MTKLLTNEQLQTIPNLYETENQKDPICHLKLFLPSTNRTWDNKELEEADLNTCYGFVDGLEKELGYFTLSELENLKGAFGLKVELDTSFKPTKLSKIKGA